MLLDVVAASGDANFRVRTLGTGSGDDTVIRALVNNTSSSNFIQFGDTGDANAGQIRYQHSNDSMQFTTNASEAVRIDSAGRLMIGTTTEGHSNADDLTVNNSANCGITIRSGSSNDGNIFFSDDTSGNGETRGVVKYKHADDALVFNSNGNERFRLDSSGRFLLGHNSDIGYGFRSQLVGTDGNTSSQAQIRFTNSASGPTFILAKSRNGTPGSKTIVNNNDNLGEIQFRGDDGVDYFGIAASIKTQIDGTPGAGDLPGRLVFSTTADGSDSATERMRISQSGDIAVNFDGSSQTGVFQIADGSASAPGLTFWADGAKDTGIFRSGANTLNLSTAGSERMRIDADGDVLVGLTSALSTQAGSIQAAGPIIAKSYINAHTSNAAILQYISNKAVLRAYGATSGSGILQFNVGGGGDATDSEAMRIAADGNVAIGTSSPETDATHHILTIAGKSSNGAGGVSFVDTSSNVDGFIFADTGSLFLNADYDNATSSSTIRFRVDGSNERARIDSAGRLLIGTTSGTSHAVSTSNNPLLQVESSSSNDYGRGSFTYNGNDAVGPGIYFAKSRGTSDGSNTVVSNGDQVGGLFFQAADGTDKVSRAASIICNIDGAPGSNDTPGRITFSTTGDGASATTEHMRITSGGDIRIGTDAQTVFGEKIHFRTGQDKVLLTINSASTGTSAAVVLRHARGGLSGFNGKAFSFVGNDSTEEGSIVIHTTSTAFNTSSDYRLKENEVAISDGITRLKQLKPYQFNFKKDPGVKVDGFFAHEVSSIVPIAVTGEKDAVKKDGSIEPQGIDQSKLVPLLTAALQEEIAKREALETRIAALEAA